jgi:hypothetical protein
MPDEQGRPLVSGAVFVEQRKVLEDVAGVGAVASALASLPVDHRNELEQLRPVSWFSVDLQNEFIEAVARAAGRDPYELNHECTKVGVERTLRTLWRVLLRFTSDNALVSRCPIFYSKNYDAGSLSAEIGEPGCATIVLSGWRAPPRMDIEGIGTGIATVLECAGRRDVAMRWKRQPEGALYTATWSR